MYNSAIFKNLFLRLQSKIRESASIEELPSIDEIENLFRKANRVEGQNAVTDALNNCWNLKREYESKKAKLSRIQLSGDHAASIKEVINKIASDNNITNSKNIELEITSDNILVKYV